jgi:hypothetical protein
MVNSSPFLNYLDKEMTIMGILSAFCIAAPAGVLATVFGKDNTVTSALWNHTAPFILLGSVSCIVAALLFYKQRSDLAWNYGQICLIQSRCNDTSSWDKEITEWLSGADGWATWWSYSCAFAFLTAGFVNYILAITFEFMALRWKWLAVNIHNLKLISFWTCAFTAICVAALQRYVLVRFTYEDDAWEAFYHKCLLRKGGLVGCPIHAHALGA